MVYDIFFVNKMIGKTKNRHSISQTPSQNCKITLSSGEEKPLQIATLQTTPFKGKLCHHYVNTNDFCASTQDF